MSGVFWVPCCENTNYEISNEGKLRNKKTNQILKGYTPPHGYIRYKINNIYYTASNVVYKSHKLVNITGDIIHLDHDKNNLNINNLMMVQRAEACHTLRQSQTIRCNNNTGHTNIYKNNRGRFIVSVNRLKSKSFLTLDEAIIYKNTIHIDMIENINNNLINNINNRNNRNNENNDIIINHHDIVSLYPNNEVIV